MRLVDLDAKEPYLLDGRYAVGVLDNVPTEERSQGEWISKEKALKIMCEKCPVYNCVSGCNSYRSIEKMSSVQSQRPQGKWIFRNGVTCGGYYKCNKCGEVERAEKNYCPNCGADMRRNTKRKGTPIEGNNESYNCENWIP